MKPAGFTPRLLIRDAVAFCLLAAMAMALGSLLNLTRSHPLPLRYVSKEKRLEGAVKRVALPTVTAVVARPADIRTIGLEEFQKFVADGSAVVLDARAETFYRLGHVPGSLNLSRENFEHDFAALRPILTARAGRPIAVYCSGADCQDSQLVAAALAKLGYETISIYPEGWEQWKEAGMPQEPPAKEGE